MAQNVHRPHDKLFRTVFSDAAEAAALLRAHLPESIAGDLRWSTLALQDRTFVDPDLRDTESDLLFSIRRKAGAPPAWLYVLLEHQSRPDCWIRFRLLKYCCRIWDRSRRQFPRERRLRPIVPLVFYQGPGRWRHATAVRTLVVYVWATQDRDTARRFGAQLRAAVSGTGGELVTYAEELMQDMARKVRAEGLLEGLQQGRREGLLEGRVGTIENLLRAGVPWPVIEAATGIDQDALRAFRQQLQEADEGTEDAET